MISQNWTEVSPCRQFHINFPFKKLCHITFKSVRVNWLWLFSFVPVDRQAYMYTCAHTHACTVVSSMWHHILGMSHTHCDWKISCFGQYVVIYCRDIWCDSMVDTGEDMGGNGAGDSLKVMFTIKPKKEFCIVRSLFSFWINWPLKPQVIDLSKWHYSSPL